MKRAGRFCAAIGLLCLAACGSGKLYPKPQSYMHQALSEIDELPPVFGSDAPKLVMDTADPAVVAWLVDVDGSELMRFVATLQPESAKATRLKLDLIGATNGPRGNIQQRLQAHPEIKRLYLAAMQEEIDAKLEERPFDITRTYPALAAASAVNMGAIAQQLDPSPRTANQPDQRGRL